MRCSSWARARAWRSDASVSARSMAAAAAVPEMPGEVEVVVARGVRLGPHHAQHRGQAGRADDGDAERRLLARVEQPAALGARHAAVGRGVGAQHDAALARRELQQRAGLARRRRPAPGTVGADPVACSPRPSDSVTTTAAAARRPRAGGRGDGGVGLGRLARAGQRLGDLEVAGAQHLAAVELALQRGAVDGQRGDLREGRRGPRHRGRSAAGARGTAPRWRRARRRPAAVRRCRRRARPATRRGSARRRRRRCARWRWPARRRRRTPRGRPVPTASSATGPPGAERVDDDRVGLERGAGGVGDAVQHAVERAVDAARGGGDGRLARAALVGDAARRVDGQRARRARRRCRSQRRGRTRPARPAATASARRRSSSGTTSSWSPPRSPSSVNVALDAVGLDRRRAGAQLGAGRLRRQVAGAERVVGAAQALAQRGRDVAAAHLGLRGLPAVEPGDAERGLRRQRAQHHLGRRQVVAPVRGRRRPRWRAARGRRTCAAARRRAARRAPARPGRSPRPPRAAPGGRRRTAGRRSRPATRRRRGARPAASRPPARAAWRGPQPAPRRPRRCRRRGRRARAAAGRRARWRASRSPPRRRPRRPARSTPAAPRRRRCRW